MITDRIKFKPGYAKSESGNYAEAGVEARGLAPERIWRNLCNISIWPRLYPDIIDIQFEDSADNDPHLFNKAQFNYALDDGARVVAQVIAFVPPKDDRAGRLACQCTVMRDDTKTNSMVLEFMVGVPDRHDVVVVVAAMSCQEETPQADTVNYGDRLEQAVTRLVEWSEKHD